MTLAGLVNIRGVVKVVISRNRDLKGLYSERRVFSKVSRYIQPHHHHPKFSLLDLGANPHFCFFSSSSFLDTQILLCSL